MIQVILGDEVRNVELRGGPEEIVLSTVYNDHHYCTRLQDLKDGAIILTDERVRVCKNLGLPLDHPMIYSALNPSDYASYLGSTPSEKRKEQARINGRKSRGRPKTKNPA